MLRNGARWSIWILINFPRHSASWPLVFFLVMAFFCVWSISRCFSNAHQIPSRQQDGRHFNLLGKQTRPNNDHESRARLDFVCVCDVCVECLLNYCRCIYIFEGTRARAMARLLTLQKKIHHLFVQPAAHRRWWLVGRHMDLVFETRGTCVFAGWYMLCDTIYVCVCILGVRL